MDTARSGRPHAAPRASAWFAIASIVLSLAAIAWAPGAFAKEKADRVEPSIVWSGATLAYVADVDTAQVLAGDRITMLDDERVVARGGVLRIDPGGLATLVLDWSALETVKHPERVTILFARPKPRGWPRLTIGVPSPTRAGVLWACGSGDLSAVFPGHGYSVVSGEAGPVVLARDTTEASFWPDTLVIRAFDDAADQEIALERGELDASLFWPGELSTHMRERPRWQGSPMATRTRGALTAVAVIPGTPDAAGPRSPARADSAGLDFLNRFLFRGDLSALDVPPVRLGEAKPLGLAMPRTSALPVVEVERGQVCARPNAIERFFAHPASGKNAKPGPPGLRLFYLDALIHPADSLGLAITEHLGASASPTVRARADSLGRAVREHGGAPLTPAVLLDAMREPLGLVRVIPLTCPLLCAPETRGYVESLGIDALADLLGRMPAARP